MSLGDPVVKGAFPLRTEPVSARLRADDGTPLQAEVFAVFDLVVAVSRNTIEPLVQMRHMIATVEIVIDKNVPVAIKGIVTRSSHSVYKIE